MHECFLCGQACDCDGEDVWHSMYADCVHECEEDDYETDDYETDREDIDYSTYRTCETCGGEFWDGGTSCTCGYDDLEEALMAFSQSPEITKKVVEEVFAERARQDAKWGEQNHNDIVWQAILIEEVGEVAQAILHDMFGGVAEGTIRKELTQVAAVALQWLECMERAEQREQNKIEFPDGEFDNGLHWKGDSP